MTIRHGVCILVLATVLAWSSEAAAQTRSFVTQAVLDSNTLPTAVGVPSVGIGTGGVAPLSDPVPDMGRPPGRERTAREPRGNPLWAVALKSLTATRERPIFLPSRRAPAPAVAGPPPPEPVRPSPPPTEPDRPRLALVGAVASEAEGIAIFLDQATRGIVRLRTGENHLGWTLRSVKGREATLQKDRETVLLALPAPTDPAAAPGAAGIPGFGISPGPAPIPGMPRMPLGPGGKEPEL